MLQKYAEIAYSHKSDMVRFLGGWIAQPLFSIFKLIAKLWIRCCTIFRWHVLSQVAIFQLFNLCHVHSSLNNEYWLSATIQKIYYNEYLTAKNAKICVKNMRYAHFAKKCGKCSKVPNMRIPHIRVFLTCLTTVRHGAATLDCARVPLHSWQHGGSVFDVVLAGLVRHGILYYIISHRIVSQCFVYYCTVSLAWKAISCQHEGKSYWQVQLHFFVLNWIDTTYLDYMLRCIVTVYMHDFTTVLYFKLLVTVIAGLGKAYALAFGARGAKVVGKC